MGIVMEGLLQHRRGTGWRAAGGVPSCPGGQSGAGIRHARQGCLVESEAPRRHLRCPSPRMVGRYLGTQPFICYLACAALVLTKTVWPFARGTRWCYRRQTTVSSSGKDAPPLSEDRGLRGRYSTVPARAEVMPPWLKPTLTHTTSPSLLIPPIPHRHQPWARGRREGEVWPGFQMSYLPHSR